MLEEAASVVGCCVSVGQLPGWQDGGRLPARHRPAWSSFVGGGMVGSNIAGQ
jgi:transcription elongation factor